MISLDTDAVYSLYVLCIAHSFFIPARSTISKSRTKRSSFLYKEEEKMRYHISDQGKPEKINTLYNVKKVRRARIRSLLKKLLFYKTHFRNIYLGMQIAVSAMVLPQVVDFLVADTYLDVALQSTKDFLQEMQVHNYGTYEILFLLKRC